MSGANAPEPPAWKRSASKSAQEDRGQPPGQRRPQLASGRAQEADQHPGRQARIKLAVALWGLVAVIGLICFLIWLLHCTPLRISSWVLLRNKPGPAGERGHSEGTSTTCGLDQGQRSAHGNKLPRVLGDDPTDLDGVSSRTTNSNFTRGKSSGVKEKAVCLFTNHGGTDSQGVSFGG